MANQVLQLVTQARCTELIERKNSSQSVYNEVDARKMIVKSSIPISFNFSTARIYPFSEFVPRADGMRIVCFWVAGILFVSKHF